MTGTFINAILVIMGSFLGLLIRNRLSERIRGIVFQAIGLFTIGLGLLLFMSAKEFIVVIFSIIFGAVLGEWLELENRLESQAEKLKQKLKFKNSNFSQGLITAFLLFCVGSFTILGAFEEGLTGNYNLLLTKSVLDGFSAIALTSAFGYGVLFSVIPLLIYQGGLTFLAEYIQPFLSESIQSEITAVGGLMILGLGLSILEIKRIKVLNFIPGLFLVLPVYYLASWLRGLF